MSDEFEKFVTDPRLAELCELQKTGDEVLDVIRLIENQHSTIMAWMFDPREGHGQGDEILRDLLVHASNTSRRPDCKLDGRSTTARFFAAWPPSRLRTTALGSVFTARELGLAGSERLDLFIVDSQNRFIVIIENKVGTKQRLEQLDEYRSAFETAASNNGRLAGYECVFIGMNRALDVGDPLPDIGTNLWLIVGYDWLKASGSRALLHVQRGNSAARLVVSYCNRQTDWDSPEQKKCVDLAASLAIAHPEATNLLKGVVQLKPAKAWLAARHESDTLLFALQNKSAVDLLLEVKGIASVEATLFQRIPGLPRDSIDGARVWLDLCPRGWEDFHGEDWWPVFLHVRYADENRATYTLAICWNADHARTNQEATALRSVLISVEPKFALYPDSRWRRVIVERKVSVERVVALVQKWEERVSDALRSSGYAPD